MMFLFGEKKPKVIISAVIAAAGSACRMEGIDKQQALLDELPVVAHSIEALSACARITEIVLVCRAEQIPDYYALVRDYCLDRVSCVVGGGETRQQSVFKGISACNENAGMYVIHDGARPLVRPELVDACIDMAIVHGAAALGAPMRDTVKMVDSDGFVTSTLSRDHLMAIQTPQVFEAELYRQAKRLAQREGATYTDDCQLLERMGKKVFVVNGSADNIKITTPEDLAVACAVLQYREEGAVRWLSFE